MYSSLLLLGCVWGERHDFGHYFFWNFDHMVERHVSRTQASLLLRHEFRASLYTSVFTSNLASNLLSTSLSNPTLKMSSAKRTAHGFQSAGNLSYNLEVTGCCLSRGRICFPKWTVRFAEALNNLWFYRLHRLMRKVLGGRCLMGTTALPRLLHWEND